MIFPRDARGDNAEHARMPTARADHDGGIARRIELVGYLFFRRGKDFVSRPSDVRDFACRASAASCCRLRLRRASAKAAALFLQSLADRRHSGAARAGIRYLRQKSDGLHAGDFHQLANADAMRCARVAARRDEPGCDFRLRAERCRRLCPSATRSRCDLQIEIRERPRFQKRVTKL